MNLQLKLQINFMKLSHQIMPVQIQYFMYSYIDCFYFITKMSFSLKRNTFKVQIKRQMVSKVLKTKRQNFSTQQNVHQVLDEYLKGFIDMRLPKILVLKLEFIEEQKFAKLLQIIQDRKAKLNFMDPFEIGLINKLTLTDQSLIKDYVNDVTNFAVERIVFKQQNSKMQIQKPQRQAEKQQVFSQAEFSCQKASTDYDEWLYLPTSLLQFWGTFFKANTSTNPYMPISEFLKVLDIVMSFTSIHCYSNWSYCYFLHYVLPVLFRYQNMEQEKLVQFIINSISNVLRLLEEGFFCDQLVEIMLFIKNVPLLYQNLLRNIRERQCSREFFSLLLEGLENENFFINKNQQVSIRYFHSQDLTKQQLHTVEQLSIENLLTTNISVKIWQCKISILEAFNGFLCSDGYQNLLFHSEIETICQKLFKTYIYSTQQGTITNRVQKIICLIFYNIFVKIENQQLQQECGIELRVLLYFMKNRKKISQMIEKTNYNAPDLVLELIEMLQEMSQFFCRIQIDEEIMVRGNLVSRICSIIKESQFNEKNTQDIMEALCKFLKYLHDDFFNFSQIANQIQELKSPILESSRNQITQAILNNIRTEIE